MSRGDRAVPGSDRPPNLAQGARTPRSPGGQSCVRPRKRSWRSVGAAGHRPQAGRRRVSMRSAARLLRLRQRRAGDVIKARTAASSGARDPLGDAVLGAVTEIVIFVELGIGAGSSRGIIDRWS